MEKQEKPEPFNTVVFTNQITHLQTGPEGHGTSIFLVGGARMFSGSSMDVILSDIQKGVNILSLDHKTTE